MPPTARRDGLVIQEMAGETIVYDAESDRASCLSPAASVVWKAADGRTTVAEMARRLRRELALEADEEIVEAILHRLRRSRLLLDQERDPSARRPLARREMLARVGRGSVLLLPIVASIVAPKAAMAASLITRNACRGSAAFVGRCCTNHKRCRVDGGSRNCNGADCTG